MKNSKRKSIIRALMCGKQYLSRPDDDSTGSRFVCVAIEHAYTAGMIRHRDMMAGKSYITHLIGGHTTVLSWLQSQGVSVYSASFDTILQYRHDWVDHMIKTLKESK